MTQEKKNELQKMIEEAFKYVGFMNLFNDNSKNDEFKDEFDKAYKSAFASLSDAQTIILNN